MISPHLKFYKFHYNREYPLTHDISYSMVLDFKKMNKQIRIMVLTPMRIGRIFSKLYQAKLCSILDIYHNIEIAENNSKYTAFTAEYSKNEFY